MSANLLDAYKARVKSGDLIADPAQSAAAKILSDFVTSYDVPSQKTGLKFLLKKRQKTPTGLYIWGSVGRGKTMLMDLLVASIKHKKVRRVHFHAFMLEIHARLKDLRAKGDDDQLIKSLAGNIAAETDLLCFDELHVNDIADAMILGSLFDALFQAGTTVIATSNYAPDDLYKDGLQRARFLPFIDLLKSHVRVVYLDSPTDYRFRALSEQGAWFAPLTDFSWNGMNTLFETLSDHQRAQSASVDVDGRELPIQRAAGHAAWCDFATLCEEARGAADYLALGNAYTTVFLDGVPMMNEERRNEARRFMTLVDTLYDQKRVLVVRAATSPDKLYSGDTGSFEYQRTLSRLIEMQSADWFKNRH